MSLLLVDHSLTHSLVVCAFLHVCHQKRIQESIVKVTDADVVRAEHRFLWEERDGEAAASDADTAYVGRLGK